MTIPIGNLYYIFAYACGRLAYQEVKLDVLEARMLPQLPLRPEEIPQPLPAPE